MGRNGKKGANQHSAKHENGIVAPGKRINKQKSNGHLANGFTDTSNGNASTSTVKETVNEVQAVSVAQYSSVALQDVSDANINSHSGPAPDSRKLAQHIQTESGSDDIKELDTMSARTFEQQHRKIDVTTAKQSTVQDRGATHLALTVLKSCPIADTMAILVILLSLPPAVLHLTNAIFAMLTFVPPSGSFATLPSLSDITSSFSPGAPSFLVLILIDLIAICIWSIMPWPHLQTVILDCAQATVATTLGGGYTFRPGSSDNLLLVVTFVFATHMGRYRRTTLKWLHRTSLTKYLPLIDSLDDLPAKPSYVLSAGRSWFDTLKIYVAIHILLQGLTRMVRRALNAPRESSFPPRNFDPEANSNSLSVENVEMNPPSSPSPLKSKMSLQNLRDARDKISSGKRRRKQANYVRSQQPLWAAIAATKSKIIREYEQSQATKDAMGPQSASTHDLGSASFSMEENKIWITGILPDKLYFETGPIDSAEKQDSHIAGNEDGMRNLLLIVVCVNGAAWASLKVLPIQDSEDGNRKMRWVGEVYGLSAANTYRVSFVRKDNHVELHSEIIVTPSLPARDQVITSTIIPSQNLRPSSPASPIATVETSITAFEASIGDLLASQKRIRKDSKVVKAKLDKELESLAEKLGRVSIATKNIAQKHTQLENGIKQMEDAIISLTEQINEQGSIPEEIIQEWREHKNTWEKIRNELSRVQEDVQRTKEDNRTSLTAAQTRELSEHQKRDRAQTRVKKLTTDYANLQAPAKNLDHRRANSSYAHRAAELDQKEAHAQFQYDNLRNKNHEIFRETLVVKNEVDHLEHIAYQNDTYFTAQTQARFIQDSRPITPEGDLPGTHSQQASGSNQSISYQRPYMFNTPELHHAIPAAAAAATNTVFTNGFRHNNTITTRHRSQSAISGNSFHPEHDHEGDYDDEDPIPLVHKRRPGLSSSGVKEGSEGRSSGSGSPHVSIGGTIPPPLLPSAHLTPAIGSERRISPAYHTAGYGPGTGAS